MGIIGLPNSGKSSLLSSLTKANPKIANYPFTTINPNLGVMSYHDKEATLADIPGLIEGAHKGSGLGHKFLKHVERCKSFLHLIDITSTDLNVSYDQIKTELNKYNSKLTEKNEIIVFNKIDLITENELKDKIDIFNKKNKKKFNLISVLKKNGLKKIKQIIIQNVHK